MALLALLSCTSTSITIEPGETAGPDDTSIGTPEDTNIEDAGENPAPTPPVVVFDPPGGTFAAPIDVSLVLEEGEEARYTTDGSVPTADSVPYTGSFSIDASTEVRVLVTNDAGLRTYGASSYVRVSSDATDFTSNLPLVVIQSPRALPEDSNYVGISLQIHDVGKDGRANLLGDATQVERAAIKVRGSSTAYDPKHSYALEIRGADDDEDHKSELLGMPEESDWVLYAPFEFDRAFLRNALVYQLSNDLGRYAPRTRFVEVFAAGRGSDVGEDDYVGIYVLMERIKRATGRVDIQPLTEKDEAPPEVTGGYIFKRDRTGDGESGFSAGDGGGRWSFQQGLVYVYPHEEVITDAQAGYLSDYIDSFGNALAQSDGVDPATGLHYSELVDVDSFIDHHILNVYAKNPDAFRLSGYFYKDREGLLVAGPVWDFDRSLGCADDSRGQDPTWWDATNITSDTTAFFTYGWYDGLFDDPDYTTAYWARWRALLDDTLSTEHVDAVIDAMADELSEAAPRNYARWSSYPPRGGSFEAEVTLLEDWVEARHDWIEACLDANPGAPETCRGG